MTKECTKESGGEGMKIKYTNLNDREFVIGILYGIIIGLLISGFFWWGL